MPSRRGPASALLRRALDDDDFGIDLEKELMGEFADFEAAPEAALPRGRCARSRYREAAPQPYEVPVDADLDDEFHDAFTASFEEEMPAAESAEPQSSIVEPEVARSYAGSMSPAAAHSKTDALELELDLDPRVRTRLHGGARARIVAPAPELDLDPEFELRSRGGPDLDISHPAPELDLDARARAAELAAEPELALAPEPELDAAAAPTFDAAGGTRSGHRSGVRARRPRFLRTAGGCRTPSRPPRLASRTRPHMATKSLHTLTKR